jgi:hypothetical protein
MDLALARRLHRRSRLRWWLCRDCLRRYPCGRLLYAMDQHSRVVHPGGEAGARLVGWREFREKPR